MEQSPEQHPTVQATDLLKSRDDPEPVSLGATTNGKFKALSKCAWAQDEELLGPERLRQRIEPWLTALFQSEHLSALIGSGLTQAVHWIAQNKGLAGMSKAQFPVFERQISEAAVRSAEKADRGSPNIEDQLRVANELLLGLSHYCPSTADFDGSAHLKKQIAELDSAISEVLENFTASILEGENAIDTSDREKREAAFGYLVTLLMSLASRSGTRDRLHLFTTNYDRVIEAGAEVAGLHLLDRFVGTVSPIFHSSRLNIDMHYNPPGIRGEPRYLEGVAHFTKLHGSVDWVSVGRVIRRIGLPFGAKAVDPYLKFHGVTSSVRDVMVYPNAAKDRETSAYPYVDLFRDFAAAICRPNSTLVTYGYGFGDEHINRVVEDMLTIPSTHLVVISYDDPMDRIMKLYRRTRPAQVTLILGSHLGDLKILADHLIPKPAIDRTTVRMADLLNARFRTRQSEGNQDGSGEAPSDEH